MIIQRKELLLHHLSGGPSGCAVSKNFRIKLSNNSNLSDHGLRNHWLLRGLWHLPARLPRWRNFWRRHLPHRPRYLHRMWLLRWSLPQRSYHPRRIIRQREVSRFYCRWTEFLCSAAASFYPKLKQWSMAALTESGISHRSICIPECHIAIWFIFQEYPA